MRRPTRISLPNRTITRNGGGGNSQWKNISITIGRPLLRCVLCLIIVIGVWIPAQLIYGTRDASHFYKELDIRQATTIPMSEIVSAAAPPKWMKSRPVKTPAGGSIPTDDPSAVVVFLRGEMGNHLSGIAHGRGLQWWMLENRGIPSQLVLHHPDHTNAKFGQTKHLIRQCFPNLKRWTYFQKQGNNKHWYNYFLSTQNESIQFPNSQSDLGLSQSHSRDLDLVNGQPIEGMDAAGAREPISEENLGKAIAAFSSMRSEKNPLLLSSSKSVGVPLPYIQSESLHFFYFLDRYLDDYKQLFAYNASSKLCCQEVPAPDESVFHFRNFASELPTAHKRLGFEEITPAKAAKTLFGHLEAGDRVAITTRTYQNRLGSTSVLEKYVHALEARGLQVRVIEGQSPMQDFCFLMNAQKELIGSVRSTFVIWASILGNAQTRLYLWDTMQLRKRFVNISSKTGSNEHVVPSGTATAMHPHDLARVSSDEFLSHFKFEWTNPELRSRIQFEVHASEELEWMSKSTIRRGRGAENPVVQ